ncbi:MAG: AI-2E family transporter [Desulfobulbaceae bacterium]|nr:AI-2E family transporter [Desulfobulbaceae bacterium]
MEFSTTNSNFKITNAASWLLLLVLLTVILQTLSFLFIPLCFAILACYAMGIPIDYLKRLRVPGFLRIFIIIVIVMAAIFMLGKLVTVNVGAFQEQLPAYVTKFWEYAGQILAYFDISTDQGKEMLDSFFSNFKQKRLASLGGLVQSLSGSFFSFLGNLMWVLLFMVFILAEREAFTRRLVRILGDDRAAPVIETMARINQSVQQYLGLKTLISLLTGAMVTVVLWLFGVDFALLWGTLVFIMNFIPTIGSIVATVPPIAITLFQYGSISKTLLVAILLIGIQVVVGNIIEPKVMGRGLNLSPLVVLLSLMFWGWIWGIPGMLLSVPLTAVIRIAMEQLDSTRTVAALISSK